MNQSNLIAFPAFTAAIKHTNRKKSIAIKIKAPDVTVLAPMHSSLREITDLLQKKQIWIEQQLQKRPHIAPRSFKTGEKFLVQGETHILEVQGHAQKKVKKNGNKIFLFLPESIDNIQNRKMLLADWYQSFAYQNMMPRIEYYQKQLGVSPNKITFGLRKSRWGSCSSKKNITINWLLAMSPQHISDYVIVHELCHLIEMNHSRHFWRLVEKILPDFQSSRAWLKEQGHTLVF